MELFRDRWTILADLRRATKTRRRRSRGGKLGRFFLQSSRLTLWQATWESFENVIRCVSKIYVQHKTVFLKIKSTAVYLPQNKKEDDAHNLNAL